nr:electron transfer flavoprotein subunit alpha/FixB family protein [Salinirubrum litoreum]
MKDVEDVDELREILAAEEAGQDRVGAKKLIESRIEKFADDGEDAGDGELDPSEMSLADLGNAIRKIEDTDRLREVLDAEESGANRDGAKRLISQRIESLTETEEDDGDGDTDEERLSPEEKHPDLDHPTADKRHVRALDGGEYRDMWVYCETQGGDLLSVSREMLGKARELMDDYNARYVGDDEADERVVAVLIGDGVSELADECIALGADVVVHYEDERLDRFVHKPYTEVFCEMARWHAEPPDATGVEGTDPDPTDWRDYDEPRYVLFPATNNGRDLSAMVQAELDSGLASDCSGLYIEDTEISNPAKTGEPGTTKTFRRVLHMKRPDFSGFEYSTILCLDAPDREFHPQGGSVIPGSFDVPDPNPEREGEVIAFETDVPDDWLRVRVTEHDRLDEGVDLTGHDVIVAVGRGIGADPTRGMELAVELADAFEDAEVGVSRGIVTGSYQFDAHVEQYTHEDRQIGETGQIVEPKIYIGAGISGAVQHKVGMDESDTIIAVNTDPDARIRDFSDYFVEGDLFEVLPRLTEAVETGELDLAAMADGGRRRSPETDGGPETTGEEGGDADV